METTEENRTACLMGLDMLTSISYVDEVRAWGGRGYWVSCEASLAMGGLANIPSAHLAVMPIALCVSMVVTVRQAHMCVRTHAHAHAHTCTQTHTFTTTLCALCTLQVEVFKTCLDYWALFVADIYSGASIPTTPGGGNQVGGGSPASEQLVLRQAAQPTGGLPKGHAAIDMIHPYNNPPAPLLHGEPFGPSSLSPLWQHNRNGHF